MDIAENAPIVEAPQLVDQDARDRLVGFREDLDMPEVGFGRCAITAEWGKIISIPLPEISLEVPDLSKEIKYDPEQGNVEFKLKTAVFPMKLSLSEVGLAQLLSKLHETSDIVSTVTPVLVYTWSVLYASGESVAQFRKDPESEEDLETQWRDIEHEKVLQYSLVPHYWEQREQLPTYTFVRTSGQFFKNGKLLDTGYEGVYPGAETPCIYARRTNLVFASEVPERSMMRSLENCATNVVQLLGWGEGGLRGEGKRCVIAVDEGGSWRPYDYVE